jgi:hypothetical protein
LIVVSDSRSGNIWKTRATGENMHHAIDRGTHIGRQGQTAKIDSAEKPLLRRPGQSPALQNPWNTACFGAWRDDLRVVRWGFSAQSKIENWRDTHDPPDADVDEPRRNAAPGRTKTGRSGDRRAQLPIGHHRSSIPLAALELATT